MAWQQVSTINPGFHQINTFKRKVGRLSFFLSVADMRVRFTICLLLFAAGRVIAGDYQLNQNCLNAYDHILSLRFGKAKEILRTESKINPDNRIVSYLENYAGFLEVIISEDKDNYQRFSARKNTLLKNLESADPQSPWHLYTQAQLNLQHAFTALRFEEYSSAALEINKAYRLLTKNAKLYPEFQPNQVALGLMQVLIGSVPQNYQWVTRVLSLQGTVEQGISNMQGVLNDPSTDLNYPFLRAETLFLLTFTTFNLSQDPEKTGFIDEHLSIEKNRRMIEKNPLLIYAKSVFLMHTGRNELAIETLKAAPTSKDYYPFYYLQYLNGVARLNRLDKEAEVWFLRYVNNFKGNSFIKSAYQRLAWIALINGDEDGYKKYMQRVLLLGNTAIDGDKQALKEANTGKIPNTKLLKARLLSDGGYYAEAQSALSSVTKTDLKDNNEIAEYRYRFARNNHKWGKTALAKADYEQTIILGENQKWYYAANSALQLALIYEEEHNIEKARQYYEKCLSMDYDEYRTSISQKAKAGLLRLKLK
jgi:hypothetical protein